MPDPTSIPPQERGLFGRLRAGRVKLARLFGRLVSHRQSVDILEDAFSRSYETSGRSAMRHPRAFLLRSGALNYFGWWGSNRSGTPPDDLPLSAVYQQLAIEPDAGQTEASRRFTELSRAIGSLPEHLRRVLILKKVHGLSQQDIAERLRLSVAQVEHYLARALLLCRDYLESSGGSSTEPAQESPGPRA